MTRRVEIFCPKCKFHPRESDRWQCKCGNIWNTFEHAGTCPECGKTWKETQCLACHKWSPHNEWYHEFTSGEATGEKVLEKSTSNS